MDKYTKTQKHFESSNIGDKAEDKLDEFEKISNKSRSLTQSKISEKTEQNSQEQNRDKNGSTDDYLSMSKIIQNSKRVDKNIYHQSFLGAKGGTEEEWENLQQENFLVKDDTNCQQQQVQGRSDTDIKLEQDLQQSLLFPEKNLMMQQQQQQQKQLQIIEEQDQDPELQNQDDEFVKDNSRNYRLGSCFEEYTEEFQKYLKNQQQQEKYNTHTVLKNETLFGISMQYNCSEHYIQKINDIGQNIFPGQKLKVPKIETENSNNLPIIEEKIQMKVDEKKKQNQIKNRFQINQQFFFCTKNGNFLGNLKVTESAIMFDPDFESFQGQKIKYNKKKSLQNPLYQYQLTIDYKDIHEVKILTNKPQNQDALTRSYINHDKILQILLYTSGNKRMEQKYKNHFQKLRKEGKPIITLFFRISEMNNLKKQLNFSEKQQILENIRDKVNEIVFKIRVYKEPKKDKDLILLDQMFEKKDKQNQKDKNDIDYENDDQNYQSITHVGMYEIIKENLYQKKQVTIKESINNLWESLGFHPKMVGQYQSNILTEKMFLSILIKVPQIFRSTNWELIYGTIAHGTSMSTMIYRCCQEYPLFLIIEDFDGIVFGVYISQPLKRNAGEIYGDGETFVFTFNNQYKDIECYQATNKNNYFIHVQDGISFGMSRGIAIFIDQNLLTGISQPIDTFDSPQLSGKQHYTIKNLEVWGLSL